MKIPTLKQDLKKLLTDIEGNRDEYKDMKHSDDDKICEAIYKGKYEAYAFVVKKIDNLLKWHATKNFEI